MKQFIPKQESKNSWTTLPASRSTHLQTEKDVDGKSPHDNSAGGLLDYFAHLVIMILGVFKLLDQASYPPGSNGSLFIGIGGIHFWSDDEDPDDKIDFKPGSTQLWVGLLNLSFRHRDRWSTEKFIYLSYSHLQQTAIMHGATCSILLCTFII